MGKWEVRRINFKQPLSPAQMSEIRSILDLRPRGRFTDPEDQIMGTREIEAEGLKASVMLFRQDIDGPWDVTIIADLGFSESRMDDLLSEMSGQIRSLKIEIFVTN
jgi:hypothetical protein